MDPKAGSNWLTIACRSWNQLLVILLVGLEGFNYSLLAGAGIVFVKIFMHQNLRLNRLLPSSQPVCVGHEQLTLLQIDFEQATPRFKSRFHAWASVERSATGR